MKKILRWLPAASALALAGLVPAGAAPDAPKAEEKPVCIVQKAPIASKEEALPFKVNKVTYYLCCPGCDQELIKAPAKYLKMKLKDPVNGKEFAVTEKTPKLVHNEALFLFLSEETLRTFKANPEKYAGLKPAGN